MSTSKRTIFSETEFTRLHCDCCSRKIGYPKEFPTNSALVWNTRNNSSNVSSLLAPDFDEKSCPSTDDGTSISKPKTRSGVRPAILTTKCDEASSHCEECYCRKSPKLPILNFKAKLVDEIKRIPLMTRNHDLNLRRRSFGVKRIPKDHNRIGTRISLSAQSKSVTDDVSKSNLTFTERRSDYESKRNEFREISEHEAGKKTLLREEGSDATNIRLNNDKRMSREELKQLSDFRKDQYFECHCSTNIGSESVTEHKCIHKFVINDRLLPEPLNCDSYGISRCDICGKPMEPFNSRKPRAESKKKAINHVKQVYEYNLAPLRLNIGQGKEIVEVRVPNRLGKECLWDDTPTLTIRRNVPGNSFALRYQKGCV